MFAGYKPIKVLIKSVVSLCLGVLLLTRTTYLFREVSMSRNNITGISKEADLDVVGIGASTVFMFYQPLTAWEKYGYTSYAYATVFGPIEFYEYYMDRVLQTNNPKLFVVDLRALTCMTDDVLESGVRYWTDSLPVFSPVRWLSIRKYMQTHPKPDDLMSYYFDIAKYHTKTQVFGIPDNWANIGNDNATQYKGHELSSVHRFLTEPVITTTQKGELSPAQSKVLYELLEFCQKRKLNVLFVICPYQVNEEEQAIYNAAGEIVTSYGYQFLNANNHYVDIGLDFATDYKDYNHVNCAGSEKYTLFLADYISQNYKLEDHRGDSAYALWDKESVLFKQDLEKYKKELYEGIEEKYEAVELAEKIAVCEDPYEWSAYVKNRNYTTITCASIDQCGIGDLNVQGKQLLDAWGISSAQKKYFLQIRSGDEMIDTADTDESIDYYGMVGISGLQEKYEAHIDQNIRLILADKDYSLGSDGVNILVFDNNFKKVVDHVILRVDSDGAVYMERG